MIDLKSRQRKCGRAAAAFLVAFASLAVAGCSGSAGEVGYVAPAQSMAAAGSAPQAQATKAGGVVGVWEGLTLASCATSPSNRCNAQQKITLTLIEEDSKLTGYYRCAYGTMNCLGMNETGKIVKANLNGGQVTARVAMPDGTSCIYTGRTVGNAVVGGYSCYGGGSLLESGSWKGKRLY